MNFEELDGDDLLAAMQATWIQWTHSHDSAISQSERVRADKMYDEYLSLKTEVLNRMK